MKKVFTLLVMLATVGVLSMQAQVLQKAPFKNAVSNRAQRAVIEPGSNQVWWGYSKNYSSLSNVGVTAADTYHCAIFVPGNHKIAGGKTIDAIRIGMFAPNVTNVKVWIASQKPSAIDTDNCLQVVDVPASELGSIQIDVPLTTPYTIPAEGVYVGYSFTITKVEYQDDAYPVLFFSESGVSNAFFLRAETNSPNWSDLTSEFGNLYLQVLLKGEFPTNMVTPSDFGPVYAEVGTGVSAIFAVENQGGDPVSSIDYTITTDDFTSAESHVDIDPALEGFSKGRMVVAIPADGVQGKKEKTLTITKVNGKENLADDKTAKFTLFTVSEIISRNVLVEQFTGIECGWCPRGHVGMANMREAYGGRFVGVAIHQYIPAGKSQTSDAMFIAKNNYAKLNFGGAPSARVNRGGEVDPYYATNTGIYNTMESEMAIPGLADVQVSGTFDEAFTKVDAKAKLRPLFEGTYKLEFVLVADGLKGSGTGWNQANYYSSVYSSQTSITKESLPDDLKFLYDLGASFYPTFNDVAIASSYVGGSNKVPAQTIAAGETAEVSYSMDLPTSTKLKNALQKDQIYVIAILIDSTGSIANVGKARVDGITGISTVNGGKTNETVFYSLDGRKLSAPQQGINIVKMSDGSTRKVMMK
jgi:hypothetical protein